MMDLTARRTGHRFIGVPVLGGIFGGEALNRVSSHGTAVDEQRHAVDLKIALAGYQLRMFT